MRSIARQTVAQPVQRGLCRPALPRPLWQEGCVSAWAQYATAGGGSPHQRDAIVAHLKEAGHSQYDLLSHAPACPAGVARDEPHYGETFHNADDYCARTFSLPMHPYLEKDAQAQVIRRGDGGDLMAENYFVHESSYVDEGCQHWKRYEDLAF